METTAAPGMPISILVVEDEVISLLSLCTTLAKKYPKVTLHQATNGRMGLELFKTHLPHIVITDINMPNMGGAQMAEMIHGIKPDTKFIVLTGYSEKLTLKGLPEMSLKSTIISLSRSFLRSCSWRLNSALRRSPVKNIQLSPKR